MARYTLLLMTEMKQHSKKHTKSNAKFWLARCGASAKGGMILLLFGTFIGQTYLVYADTSETVQLSPVGVAGREVWLANNCQACHQLHGFGGFLGPDLTNVTARVQKPQLAAQLSKGQGQMPRFDLSHAESEALWNFLESMNDTGTGQALNPNLNRSSGQNVGKIDALRLVIEESGTTEVAKGFKVFQTSTCMACHTLYGESAVGAPDLSRSGTQLSASEILQVLEHGRLPGMPPSGLSPDDRASVQAFIVFSSERRAETLSRVVENSTVSFWRSLPWWEFE